MKFGLAPSRLVTGVGIVLALWFLLTFLYLPNGAVVHSVLNSEFGGPLEVVGEVWGSARVQRAILTTLVVTAISLVSVTLVGVTQAFILEAFELRGKWLLTLAYATPLVFSSVSAVTGYVMIYGNEGIATKGLQAIFPSIPSNWFSGIPAIIIVHTFTMTSYHFLFLRPAIRNLDFSVVEAARSLGQPVIRALIQVVIPLMRPMIFASLFMVLIGSLSSFAAPNILGGRDTPMVGPLVLELNQLGRPDMAAVLGGSLAIVTAGGLVWALRVERRANIFAVNKSARPFKPIRVRRPAMRVGVYLVAYGLAFINLAPLALISLLAFSPSEDIRAGKVTGGFTAEHFRTAFSDPNASQPIVNSLILTLIAISITLVLGTFISHLAHQRRNRLTDVLQLSVFLPYFLPGVLIALGFLIIFGDSNALLGGSVLVGSFWILPLAYVVVLLPTFVRFVRATYSSIDPGLEDAAKSLGATPMRRFTTVAFPALLPVLIQVSALGFNQSFDEYTVSVMLYNVSNQPLGVVMGGLAAAPDPGLVGIATAYVVLNTAIALVVILGADRCSVLASRRLTGAARRVKTR
ncbi:ABC transporter permease [Demetria terragena]|uniref:ABC transporter permease n=1 Tax=Demetria terragena TaxID=63959 RepID=UPI0003829A7E|nr:iron ABC transporter permease [Demetria terragena]